MSTIQTSDDLFLLFRQKNILQRFHLNKIGVFGSLARGEKFKDIDILIEEEIDHRKLLQLKKLLELETGFKVDIVHRSYAEPLILHRALKEVKYETAS